MVGERVRAARLQAGLTCQQLADKAGIGRAHLNRIELGHIPSPGEQTLRRIADALTVPVGDLLDGPRDASDPDGDVDDLVRLWRQLRTPEERADFVVAVRMAGSRRPDSAMIPALAGVR